MIEALMIGAELSILALACAVIYGARAIVSTHREAIDIDRGRICVGFPDPVKTTEKIWAIKVSLMNVGRDPATVKEIGVSFRRDEEELQHLSWQEAGYGSTVIKTDTTLTGGQRWDGLMHFQTEASEGKAMVGYVVYVDGMGRKWRTRFCVAVYSEQRPDRNFYHPAGSAEYHLEERL